MFRRSISNLALPDVRQEEVGPSLVATGLEGIEVAPTAVWPEAPFVRSDRVFDYARRWHDQGLVISGIQSLLFGHPELQLFDQDTWWALRAHLIAMIQLGGDLGATTAVFGSPRNRIRGSRSLAEAHELCADFLSSLLPVLSDCNVVLALEPNAPAYGADYLIHYADTISLSDLIGSPWVQPQVDAGSMVMVGDDPAASVALRTPAHVHVSTPDLLPPPGPVDHPALHDALLTSGYDRWIVLEMLQATPDPLGIALESARWLSATYRSPGQ